ncbi:rRNA biogenesis protein RRP5 [Citrus sinensis]|uniref:rRNA biogenesis protein RRP5 n=1 Tax=Citrus sinensis TaxID=2711 RepID=A0ACB8JY77_CITSI|nr:rRNA biogenesis protein RRP5 [Citrus sinensis]
MAASSRKSQKKSSKDGPKFNKASKKQFKNSKKQINDAVEAQALALPPDDDVPVFPRGGGHSLTQRERDEIHAEVDAEFEAVERGLHKKNKKKKKKTERKANETVDDLGSLFGDGISGKLPRYANKITLKNISAGMKLWGVVAEVNEKDLVICLPGGLRGLARAADALDPILDNEIEANEDNLLPTIFHVGQLVSCIVLQLDDDKKEIGKRKIWLSLRLSLLYKGLSLETVQEGMVLTAYVKSIEDHGYILHFGLPSFTGFLPRNNLAENSGIDVKPGLLLQGVVRSIDRTRKVVYLSSDPDTVSKCVTKDLKGISIDLLVPGMMVSTRVQSILENGVMLSFLTYFTGTRMIGSLQHYPLGCGDCRSLSALYLVCAGYVSKNVNARILFVDPTSRAVGLTLNPYLLHNRAPPSHVKVGDIYDQSKVVRVDRGLGLLLDIPSTPVSTPAYVTISDVAEEEVRKLEKKYKEGSCVRVRILGFRHLEGLATGILKASAFEGLVFTHSDVKPGMVVKGKVIAVDSFGAIVQFPGGVKALCPLPHMSEFEIVKPGKKFKVGAELVFRVLGVKSKRITVTHKKTLVKSKLAILSSYAEATDRLITHGWITKIEKHGCFVRSELGLDPGCEPSSMYHVGQVVKCRIMSSIPASRRINLSFMMKPTRVSEDDLVKLGSLVSGVVDVVTPNAVVVYVIAKGYSKGTIPTEHLADHLEHATVMKSVIKPGYEFDQLLVLDNESSNLLLSAKYSLINSAQQLPSDASHIHPNSVVHGYVCNIIETGCFVRFLGRLTGFAPRSKAVDGQRADLSKTYCVGQSVRSNILDVNSETGRITLSLKQSCCSSTDASFMQEHFLLEEKIAMLQSSNHNGSELKWVEGFIIGSVIEGKVHESNDFGVVVSFEKHSDVYGFITHHQLAGATVETGSVIQASILDVAKAERLVDLSLKTVFIDRFREANSNRQAQKKVLSLPEYNHSIGYASVSDYNTQKFPQKQFLNGQSVIATVMALPSPSTAGRLLLLLKAISETETSSSKRAKKKSSYDVGSLVQAEITEIKPLELRLKFGIGFHGRIHITEVNDDKSNVVENLFSNFKIGQTVTARIIAKSNKPDMKKSFLWELSIKPSMLTVSEIGSKLLFEECDVSIGQRVTGYVYKVDNEWASLTISRHLKAQLFILDSACEPSELQQFQRRFHIGKAVTGHVLSINKEKKLLRLVLQPFQDGISDKTVDISNDNMQTFIHEGDIVGGRISKILSGVGGLVVQIGPHLYGRVHFTELKNICVSDPLSGYHEGQFVKCKVLEISRTVRGTLHVELSLRSSLDGMSSTNSSDLSTDVDTPGKHLEKIEDLSPNMIVQGYVKNVTSKGCFIMLSRKLDAKVLLSNLSDGYVESPEKEFPIGKLVAGRVLSVEPLSKRVEVTLKTSDSRTASQSEINNLSNLHVGDIVIGQIKRVESYGLFITIENTNLMDGANVLLVSFLPGSVYFDIIQFKQSAFVGLCHVSELSEDHVDNIETIYRAGEKVKVKILKVDKEKRRISLGMKSSYFKNDADNLQMSSEEESDEAIEEVGSYNRSSLLENSSVAVQDMDMESEDGGSLVLAQIESRASVPPLEVNLDDEQLDMDNGISQNQRHTDEAKTIDEKNNRHAKKKEKEEREQEIRAAEERLLEKDAPRTPDEFERLVRSSPNSSFVWIKYMAFMLSMADVEKARSIAERALQTINIREENEKLNIWVAYFNLENEYGNPPEEAVVKVFQRALQYCDPKKVHLALLGLYERTEQNKLADELLYKMIKKFKHSCKVWLRRVQRLLKQQQEGVQAVVQRALLSLPRHKHIKFISQTAILEFKNGVADRGRSMFEGILREYPKRTDLWSIYLDQEIRLGDVDLIRGLFERAISLSLPPKKMKFLFKKYLEYEKSVGEEERIEYVKQKAMEYVESTLA